MKIGIKILGVVIVLGIILFVAFNDRDGEHPSTATFSEFGVQFSYSSDEYEVRDPRFESGNVDPNEQFVGGVILQEKQQEPVEPETEGPPTISLFVFENDQRLSPSNWVDRYPDASHIPLVMGEVDRDAILAGANAVRYRADGLYAQDVVVVAINSLIYVFSGAFISENSNIYRDYRVLLESVEFTPVRQYE